MSVLNGLLNHGELDESKAYLNKLKTVSTSLSFPYQTGNPVVDILLSGKLRLAKEITTEISLLLPRPCGIEDFDLCVIFAYALDNSINACRLTEGVKKLGIRKPFPLEKMIYNRSRFKENFFWKINNKC